LKWKNKLIFASIVLSLAFIICSCELINLEQIEYSTYPGSKDAVVGESDLQEAIWIEFSITPNKTSAEDLFSVTSHGLTQDGDFSWQGNRLIFTPVPEWKLARRYVFSFDGELMVEDGRSFDIRCTVPFYGGEISVLPQLMFFTPEDGATVAVDNALVLTFSEAMDQQSFEEEFSLSPNTDFDITWDVPGTIATITPQDQWNNLTQYNWYITDELTNTQGVAVVESYSGSFITQADSIAPGIQSITAAEPNWATFFPDRAPPDLNNLYYKDVIKIIFDEPVKYTTVQSAFSIQPNVVGFVHEIVNGPDTYYVFLPEEGYVMDQLYHLTIANTVEDLAGNKMLQKREEWFKAGGIDPIEITDIVLVADGISITDFNSYDPISFNLEPLEDRYLFKINFDPSAFSGFPESYPAVQNAVAQAITCSQIAPTTSGLTVYSISWPNEYTLDIGFIGFKESTATKPYRYKLLIPGGATGIVNQDGSRLTEDIFIYLEEDGP